MAVLTLVAIANAAILCHASEFLKGVPQGLDERINEEELRSSLLSEIESTLGEGSAVHRLDILEDLLKPIFQALPKNRHGKLEHSAGRYALHRLFVLRHGWKITGLGPNSGKWNSSSPAGVLKDQAPAYIQDLFEERLGGKGLGLHELAILAATIEHLIHKETISKLGLTFDLHQLSTASTLDAEKADEVLDTYMMAYIVGQNLTEMSLSEARSTLSEMPDMFIAWKNTQALVRNIRKNMTQASDLDFDTMTRIAEEIGEQFGSFFSTQCQIMKQKLMTMGDASTGRVKISDFYRASLDGAWQFQESVSYLRQLGALEESDAKTMSVVIPNYINSHGNCIPSPGYYAICCKDECEGLLGHLEENLAAPEAKPAAIAALVEKLPSSTQMIPQKPSPNLLKRLEDIAATNGGSVPLHGRLFAQWMHHAYPLECAYPHISGTTSQQTPDEWQIESGTDPLATKEEMLQFGTTSTNSSELHAPVAPAKEKVMPWTPEEELLIMRPNSQLPAHDDAPVRPVVKSATLFAFACSLAFGLMKSFHAVPSSKKDAKFCV
jgi:hypothetical protein